MTATQLPSPAASGITLWLVDLSLPPSDPGDPEQTALLSEAERGKASRFHFERDARRYRASHTALRQLLAQATNKPARSLTFVEGSFGKPRLWGGERPYFNMSHSGDWALIGFCDEAPIGVDIEVPRDMSDLESLAQRNFSAAEFQALLQIDPHQRQEAFLRCWTRKEACLKALGSGLSIEPSVFEAGIEAAPRVTSIHVGTEACGMEVYSLHLPLRGLAACARLAPGARGLAM
ncbi:MAG: 4'-phosphopantetheinyl transferase superfamily protein [Hydrogenophaga sp.]|jgi:4'-phosphopantetheinyl transferase|uniref:4'-phosphopantetheinyl transferase family protein n=1 Tax=Hydrogenophaga sp. TaxID=1904254 RepID=UPI0026341638|nr:4'-phosphopantetheinyl transferase superfamily protein [Hydrogenophaga sp.]MCW5672632.1 4'-phosphopantetheinyl transferase superfamily protein [Hydrogenophaga sp.]